MPPSSTRACLKLACAIAGLWFTCAAQAQWSGSVGVDSDYRFRGVSFGGGKPTLRVNANFDAAAGWYAGAAATQTQLAQGDRYAQLLGYAGYLLPTGAGGTLDVGATASAFIGSRQYDFAEASVGLLFDRWSLRANYAPDYFGRHVQALYLDASGHAPLGDAWRLFGHAGVLAPMRSSASIEPEGNRTRMDVRAGVGWAVRDFDFTVAWSTVTRGGPFPAAYENRRSGWVLSASWFF